MNHLGRMAAGLALACSLAGAVTPELSLDGDRMTLVAEGAALGDVLDLLTRCGVAVAVDPDIRLKVKGTFVDMPVSKVVDQVVGVNSYILTWDVWSGPLGTIPRLASLQIFEPGHPEDAKPLPGGQRHLRVTRGPDGRAPEHVADEILIGVKPGVSMEEFRRLIAQLGGTIVGCVRHPGVYLVRFTRPTDIPSLAQELKNNPIVSRAEPNYAARLPSPASGATGGAADAAPLPPPPDGAARLAVLDSGLKANMGLDGAVVDRYDALNPDQPLGDNAGHGTQMAMIAAGAVSPAGMEDGGAAVPLVAIRAFDDDGITSNFALMRALDRAVETGARVVNLSWGSETDSDFVRSAMGYAQERGLVVVAAAGNQPTGKPFYPSAYPGVVSVSAMDPSGAMWPKSNYGNTVTVAAPGTASFPVGYNGDPGAYAGTSIASAYAARTLALYFTKNPSATAADAVKALQSSVTDAGTKGRDPYYGYGALDEAAVTRLLGTP